MRDAEYDRFGPWVIPISAEDPPSALFLPYLTRSETPLFSVKVPRKIERRNAQPGMHLYDYHVSLYEAEMEILQRVGDEVEAHVYRYDDIQYIRLSEELLKGTLHLAFAEEAFSLPYNTVSKGVMGHLVGLIRERYTSHTGAGNNFREARVDTEQLSYYFRGLLERLKSENPRLRVLAVQPNRAVGSLEQSMARRLFYGTVSKTLLESMHLSDGRELMIIDRGRIYRYKWQSVYGCSTYTLPLERIQGTSWQIDGKNRALTHLQINLAGNRIRFVLLESNPGINFYNNFMLGHR